MVETSRRGTGRCFVLSPLKCKGIVFTRKEKASVGPSHIWSYTRSKLGGSSIIYKREASLNEGTETIKENHCPSRN
jgi:hypothetical protein